MSLFFRKSYSEYWYQTVNSGRGTDGLKVPGPDVHSACLELLGCTSRKFCAVLDVPSGHGRFTQKLRGIADKVISADVIEQSLRQLDREKSYPICANGIALPFADGVFDFVHCWAGIEVFQHTEFLCECVRVMRKDGLLLFTGKNARYQFDDWPALQAEKAAQQQGFQQYFTYLEPTIAFLESIGAMPVESLAFARRGDFGSFKLMEPPFRPTDNFYEFVVLAVKAKEVPKEECLRFTSPTCTNQSLPYVRSSR